MKYFKVAIQPDNDGDENVCELTLFINMVQPWCKPRYEHGCEKNANIQSFWNTG